MSFYGYREPKFVALGATTDGVNSVIAAVAGYRIVVLGYVVSANAAGVIKFQDDSDTPNVFAEYEFTDSGGAAYVGRPASPAFATARSVGLDLHVANGVDATGHLTYLLAD